MSGIQKALESALAKQGRPVPTAISLLVDRSVFMMDYEFQVASGVKSFIKDQQELRGSAIFTLSQFDHDYDVVFQDKEIKQIDASQFHYTPRGGASLLDAIIRAVKDVEKYLKGAASKDQPQPKKVVVALFADGQDTSSQNSVDNVRVLIEEKVKSGWNFLFLGAGGNTLEFAKELGIPEETTAIYSVDNLDIGIKLLSEKVAQIRRGKAVRIDQPERLALRSSANVFPKKADAEFWQNRYLTRVDRLTKVNKEKGVDWIFPKNQEDAVRLDDWAFREGFVAPSLGSWLFPKEERSFSEVHRAYWDCRSDSNIVGCMNSDPQSRNATIKFLARNIQTVLPRNAEESQHIPIEDCFSKQCPEIGKLKPTVKASGKAFTNTNASGGGQGAASGQTTGTGQTTGSQSNPQPSNPTPTEDCFSSTNCPEIDKNSVHERERKAAEAAYTTKPHKSTREEIQNWLANMIFIPPEWMDVQEVLRFRKDDLREKLLFIAVEKDTTDRPALNPSLISGILSKLSQKFDLKYVVLKRHADICKLVDSANKVGNLGYIIIEGHGDPSGIVFDADDVVINGETRWDVHDKMTEYSNFARCFSGVKPNGKILLMSCSTGGMKNIGTREDPIKNGRPFDNYAQKMANAAKRVFIAPKDLASTATSLLNENDDVGFYEPESKGWSLYGFNPFYNTNLYEAFRPNFKQCSPEIDKTKIHEHELSVLDVIREDLIKKSLLHEQEPPDRANEYLQLCKDDEREKVIVLSAQYDKNGALNPSLHTKILSLFADRFDLLYQKIESYKDICKAVENGKKFGKVISNSR
jgi:hypothetical protein